MRWTAGLLLILVIVLTPRTVGYGQTERTDDRYHGLESALRQMRSMPHGSRTSAEEARTIEINLTRWSDLPSYLGDSYLLINIPSTHLEFWDQEKLVQEMTVLVGNPDSPTPTLSDARLTSIDIHPDWVIPSKILETDVLPKALRNPNYLEANNIKVFRSQNREWKEINSFDPRHPGKGRLKYVQGPAPTNPLGRIRFNLDSPRAICVHDTPEKERFRDSFKFITHGCIRAESPEALVLALVATGHLELPIDLNQLLIGKEQVHLELLKPIPVYVTYFTAWIDSSGGLRFESDIYGWDQKMRR